MNERIEKLAEQVGMLRDKYGLYWNAHVHDNPNDGVDLEKFAELIIKECAYIAEHNVMNISTYADAEFVGEQIKQHFGVE